MYVIIVYDTEQDNCARLHKFLKRYLHWNQRSVFEGSVTEAQLRKVRKTLEEIRADESHIVLYVMENEKLLQRQEMGQGGGIVSNIL